jgi:hypothetical protein
MRGCPISSVHLFMRTFPTTPVDRTVAYGCCSPPVLAFARFAVARHPLDHAGGFLRESCDEADRIACAAARIIASSHQPGIFTVELAPPVGWPQTSVDYDYAGKQPIPATGLAPARNTALWAADGRHEEKVCQMTALFVPNEMHDGSAKPTSNRRAP